MLKTVDDYKNEFQRIQQALKQTDSGKLRRDYTKYLARLSRELLERTHPAGGWGNPGRLL